MPFFYFWNFNFSNFRKTVAEKTIWQRNFNIFNIIVILYYVQQK